MPFYKRSSFIDIPFGMPYFKLFYYSSQYVKIKLIYCEVITWTSLIILLFEFFTSLFMSFYAPESPKSKFRHLVQEGLIP